MTVLSFPGQNAVNLAIASGRAEVGMADSPVVAYQIKQSNGQFKLVGKTYAFAPYGLAIPKNSGLATADARRAEGADRERQVQGRSSKSGGSRTARSPNPTDQRRDQLRR